MTRFPQVLRRAARFSAGLVLLALPVLGWAANIAGRVTSIVDGHPLAGATVSANGLRSTTDANGYYTLYSLAPGAYTVTAVAPGFFSRAATVNAGSDVVYQDFQLATGGQIQGTVTGANGAPVGGASVSLQGGLVATSVTVTTDLAGNFNSNWVPVGGYTLAATAGGAGSATIQATVSTGAVTRVSLGLGSKTTVGGIQNLPGWESCSATHPSGYVCAAGWGNAVYSTAQYQRNPSLSGSSMQFSISGSTPYSNALWWKQLTPAPEATHFDYDFWVYLTDSNAPQSLEFDVNQTLNNTRYIFGTQCNFRDSRRWDVWDGLSNRWIPSSLPCVPFQAFSWNHFTWHFERSGGMVHYIALTINGTRYPIDMWLYPQANVNASELNVAVQLDGNWAQQPYSIWVDNLSITYW